MEVRTVKTFGLGSAICYLKEDGVREINDFQFSIHAKGKLVITKVKPS